MKKSDSVRSNFFQPVEFLNTLFKFIFTPYSRMLNRVRFFHRKY
jgi:hypothetical protein